MRISNAVHNYAIQFVFNNKAILEVLAPIDSNQSLTGKAVRSTLTPQGDFYEIVLNFEYESVQPVGPGPNVQVTLWWIKSGKGGQFLYKSTTVLTA